MGRCCWGASVLRDVAVEREDWVAMTGWEEVDGSTIPVAPETPLKAI